METYYSKRGATIIPLTEFCTLYEIYKGHRIPFELLEYCDKNRPIDWGFLPVDCAVIKNITVAGVEEVIYSVIQHELFGASLKAFLKKWKSDEIFRLDSYFV